MLRLYVLRLSLLRLYVLRLSLLRLHVLRLIPPLFVGSALFLNGARGFLSRLLCHSYLHLLYVLQPPPPPPHPTPPHPILSRRLIPFAPITAKDEAATGNVHRVLLERPSRRRPGAFVGRSDSNFSVVVEAPETSAAAAGLTPGLFADVKVGLLRLGLAAVVPVVVSV